VLDEDMRVLRDIWEETSHRLDLFQRDPVVVREERKNSYDARPRLRGPLHAASDFPGRSQPKEKPKVAVIREEGSNGDREDDIGIPSGRLRALGCGDDGPARRQGHARSVPRRGLRRGFSYADVLDSAKGWAASIRFNTNVWEQFERFYHRSDTFSLGVCNGCQLMALLGWVPGAASATSCSRGSSTTGRQVRVAGFSTSNSKKPLYDVRGMEGSTLGIWVAHGEVWRISRTRRCSERQSRASLHYGMFDDEGAITESYPFNPNGSPAGIAGLCSPDGRHLAMMPHPERGSASLAVGLDGREQMKRSL